MEIHKQAEKVQTREELAVFIRRLRDDFRDDPSSWENDTLDRYLDALSAWTNDMGGYLRSSGVVETPASSAWGLIAVVLETAKYYE